MGGRGGKSPSGGSGRVMGGSGTAGASGSSSGGGAGGTVHDRIANARTVDEIREAFRDAHMPVVISQEVERIDIDGVRIAAAGVAQVLELYPEVAIHAGILGSDILITDNEQRKRAYASASYRGSVNLNKKFFDDSGKLGASYDSCLNLDYVGGVHGRTSWHPLGTSERQITAHEMGHLVERSLISKALGGNRETSPAGQHYRQGVEQWRKHTQATRVIGEACKRVKKTEYGKGRKNDELVDTVSRYASNNRSEALAECIADYAANGANANPLSIAVHDIIKSELG